MEDHPMIRMELVPLHRHEPFDQYLAQVRRILALEAEREYTLAKRWRERGDLEAKHRLIASQLRLVAKIAWRYRSYGQPFSTLIHAGNIGLMDAVKRFDPDRGIRLATYSTWRIHAAILDCVLQSWSLVRVGI